MTDPIVGIDLGTSNTVVAHADAVSGKAQVLADANGYKIHPSVVSFHPTGGVVVGAAAKQRKVIDPKNTIFSIKRLIGRSFQSPEVQTAKQRMPYQLKEGANQLPIVVTRGGEFAVPEISAIVLDHARNVATTALGTEVKRAVVTVPASFNDAQRSATATAGSIAGLTVVRVLNEPTAAALAYGHTRKLDETIAVYDFGGGTFDITILKLADQVYEVLGTAGDTFLGGDDIDERLVDRMVEKFLMESRIDLRTNEISMMRLRAVAEQTKIELSRRSRAVVRVDEIAYGPNGKPLDLQIEIRRDELVRQIADLVDKTFPVCEEALKYANLDIAQIDDVILVGGTTKIPYVRDQVARFFGKAPRTDVNPEEAVAVGAALQASALERVLDRERPSQVPFEREPAVPVRPERTTEYSEVRRRPGERAVTRGEHHDRLEIAPAPAPPPGAPVIGRLTKNVAPAKTSLGMPIQTPPPPAKRLSAVPPASPQANTLMIEPSRSIIVDPSASDGELPTSEDIDFPDHGTEKGIFDEPISPASTAKGFAPPAVKPAAPLPPPPAPSAMPTTYPVMQTPVIMDVTPRGLGIGTVAGFCEELIRRNSRVPTEIRKLFTTSRDHQDAVHIIVCQGESRRLDNNVVIGDLTLQNLPRRPRGETSIEVTFHLDANGILQVRARDPQTGTEQRASLDLVGGMPQQDVSASRERLQALRR